MNKGSQRPARVNLDSVELIELPEAQSKSLGTDVWDWVLRAAIVAGLLSLLYMNLSSHAFRPLLDDIEARRWIRFIERPSVLWSMMGTLMLCVRTLLWFRYRPVLSVSHDSAPSLTVVIPAYNEGAMVRKSIESVAAASYPRDRLEIIVVDDGSKDDTWEHIQRAATGIPGEISVVRQPENYGKRAALEAGFRRARGEIVVTIDSDSVIDEGTLLAVVAPFRDPRVGAVAGQVRVLNGNEGIIARMLSVRFIFTFDFLRAAQSSYGTVYCCPGALSAYRVNLVRPVLDRWMAQKFLGVPCSYGEDRALTNFIFEQGYDAVYQSTAVVRTIVPTTYSRLCKMYLRWERSYVREEIRFARIVWRRPLWARIISVIDCTVTNLRYPVGYAVLVALAMIFSAHPLAVLRLLLVIGFVAALNMLYYLKSERSWNFVFGIIYAYFAFFGLLWIFPYAVVTLRSRSWMTR